MNYIHKIETITQVSVTDPVTSVVTQVDSVSFSYQIILRNGFTSLVSDATAVTNSLRKYAYGQLGFHTTGSALASGAAATDLNSSNIATWQDDTTYNSGFVYASSAAPEPKDLIGHTFQVNTSAGVKKFVLMNWDVTNGNAIIRIDNDSSVVDPIIYSGSYSQELVFTMLATGHADASNVGNHAVGSMLNHVAPVGENSITDLFVTFFWPKHLLTDLATVKGGDLYSIVSAKMVDDNIGEDGIIGKYVSHQICALGDSSFVSHTEGSHFDADGNWGNTGYHMVVMRFNVFENNYSQIPGGTGHFGASPNGVTLIKKIPVSSTTIRGDDVRSYLVTLKDSFGDTWNNTLAAVSGNVRIVKRKDDWTTSNNSIEPLAGKDVGSGQDSENVADLVIRKGQVANRHRDAFAFGHYNQYDTSNYTNGLDFHRNDPGAPGLVGSIDPADRSNIAISNPDGGNYTKLFTSNGASDFEEAARSICYVIQLGPGDYEITFEGYDDQVGEISLDIHQIVEGSLLKYITTKTLSSQILYNDFVELNVRDNEQSPIDLDFYTIMNDSTGGDNTIKTYTATGGNNIGSQVRLAQFLMKADYLNEYSQIVLGNLNSYGFLRLLETFVNKHDGASADLIGLQTDPNATSSAMSFIKNAKIVKEEYKGRINRDIKRLTDESGTILSGVELNIDSIIHVMFDHAADDGTFSNIVIKISDDKEVVSFSNSSGDEEIHLTNDQKYYSNGIHNMLRFTQSYNDTTSEDVDLSSVNNFSDNTRARIPILRLNWDAQLDEINSMNLTDEALNSNMWGSNAHDILKASATSDIYEVEWVVSRDELESLDDLPTGGLDTGGLDKGENYILVKSSFTFDTDSGQNAAPTPLAPNTPKEEYLSILKKINFLPNLNEVLTVYYKVGQPIRKEAIADNVYYRDAFGYVSPYNRGIFLNRSLHYFIQKEVIVRTYDTNSVNDYVNNQNNTNSGVPTNNNPIIKTEKRKYRFYLDFVESLPEYDFNYDNKIYDNNIIPLGINLNDLVDIDYNPNSWYPNNTVNRNAALSNGTTTNVIDKVTNFEVKVMFSPNTSTNDIYEMIIDNNDLFKSVASSGEISLHYDVMINNILKTMDRLYGKSIYDSEIYLSAIEVINVADGTISTIRPVDAPLQRVVLSSDGSTTGAEAVIVDATIHLDNDGTVHMGEQLKNAINLIFDKPSFNSIRILSEEKMGYKINRLTHMGTRKKLTFNSNLLIHLGENIVKRVIIRERYDDDIVRINEDNLDLDQEIVLSTINSSLTIQHGCRFDFQKLIGGDSIEVDAAATKTWEYSSQYTGSLLRHLVTRKQFMNLLNSTNFDHVFIKNNKKRINRYNVQDNTLDNPLGIGLLKLSFTTIINKVLAVYYDAQSPLNMPKSALQKRVYYLDSLNNDYVSDLHSNAGTFNADGRYFIETTVDTVTYRLKLQFMAKPLVYSNPGAPANGGARATFDSAMFLQTDTKLAYVFNLDLRVSFSSDKTSNDLHTMTMPKNSLIQSVDNEGRILISYENIVKNIEKKMKELYGSAYYDREMYLWDVSTDTSTVFSIPDVAGSPALESDCMLRIAPLEYTCPEMVVVDMDASTVTVESTVSSEKWDFSVKSYGNFIDGDYNLNTDQVDVSVNMPVIWNSVVLFDERNPDFRFKEITFGASAVEIDCGNIDETSLDNVARTVRLYKPNPNSATDEIIHMDKPDPANSGSTIPYDLNIIPMYVLNRVYVEESGSTSTTFKKVAGGVNKRTGANRDFVTSLYNSSSGPAVEDLNIQVILRKIVSGGLFTSFSNFPLVKLANADSNSSDSAVVQFKSKVETKLMHLDTSGANTSNDSLLFKYYNAMGKLDEDLDKTAQYPNTGNNHAGSYKMDLDDFKINLIVQFKGKVSATGSEAVNAAAAAASAAAQLLQTTYNASSTNSDILGPAGAIQLLNDFFANSNTYLDTSDNQLKYQTTVKFQYVNKMEHL